MGFPTSITTRPYTKADVTSLSENQKGVYGLFRQGAWVYIGRGDLRERLLSHLNGDNSCITHERPTRWKGWVTADHVQQEKNLIVEYDPICNKKVG